MFSGEITEEEFQNSQHIWCKNELEADQSEGRDLPDRFDTS